MGKFAFVFSLGIILAQISGCGGSKTNTSQVYLPELIELGDNVALEVFNGPVGTGSLYFDAESAVTSPDESTYATIKKLDHQLAESNLNLEHFDALKAYSQLSALFVVGFTIDHEILEAIRRSKIPRIRFIHCHFDTSEEWPEQTTIKYLEVSSRGEYQPPLDTLFNSMPNLHAVSLVGVTLRPEDLNALLGNRDLESLEVTLSELPDNIESVLQMKNLKLLSLRRSEGDTRWLKDLESLNRLETVDVAAFGVSFEEIRQFKYPDSLEILLVPDWQFEGVHEDVITDRISILERITGAEVRISGAVY